MDLKTAYEDNSRAAKLTRAGMVISFLVTGGILVATLAFAKPYDQRFDTLLPQASLPK